MKQILFRTGVLATLVLPLSCVSGGPYTWVTDLPLDPAADEGRIEPRDTLMVLVDGQTSLTGEFAVRDDGFFQLPLVGNMPVAGLTPRQAADALAFRLKSDFVAPHVTLAIAKSAPIRVSVVGEVKTPGVYELVRDRSLLGTLAVAGWVTEFARSDAVFVVRRAPKATRVRFRLNDIKAAEPHAAAYRLRDGDAIVVE